MTLSSLTSGDAGAYSCNVTGPDGTVPSGSANLTVIDAVSITSALLNQTNGPGTTAVFTVVNGVLLRALPYREPAELIAVYEKMPWTRRRMLHAQVADALEGLAGGTEAIALGAHHRELSGDAEGAVRAGGRRGQPLGRGQPGAHRARGWLSMGGVAPERDHGRAEGGVGQRSAERLGRGRRWDG